MTTLTDIELVITDDSNLRTWRTEIPNIIDDLGLDPYQRALYTHYKRVCGAAGGTCTQGVRRVADNTKMSTAKVSIARRQLTEKGLIIEHPQPKKPGHKHGAVYVTMVDIWRLNFLYFSFRKRPDITGWTVPQLEAWTETVYVVNGDDEEMDADRLQDKRPVTGVNGEGGSGRLQGKQKKEPCSSKKEPNKKNGADAPKRKPAGRNAIKAELETHFAEVTELDKPPAKTEKQQRAASQRWWKPLLEIAAACDDDVERTRNLITWTVQEMDREGLTISHPLSIVNIAKAEQARRKRSDGNGRAGKRTNLDKTLEAGQRLLERGGAG
jgi:hypothetical protein